MMAISIIIPAYNRGPILRKTLDSILSQSSQEWECIVVDDHSKDDTSEVVKNFMSLDNRYSYYLNEYKKGAQGARNTGLKYAKCDWVIFFDSDNLMHGDFIEKITTCISDNYDVVACRSRIIDVERGDTGRVMDPRCKGSIHNRLFTGRSYVDFNQAIIRKTLLEEIGCLDEDCPSMQEWDTHIRLSKIARYYMIDECLIDYFVGGKDAISSNKKREVIGRLYILDKYLDEWKKRPKALTSFTYQIYTLIKMNEDEFFVIEKMKELRKLVPFFTMRVAIFKLWVAISKLR